MGDFAGMTSEVQPPQPEPVMLQEPAKMVPDTVQEEQKNEPADPWASLVDLDLNKTTPTEHTAQRRASINAGPTLSSKMKAPDASRRGSMPSMSSMGEPNPFAVPAAQAHNGAPNGGPVDPFAQAQPFQQQQPFGGQPQYGQGLGGAPSAGLNPFGPGNGTMGYGSGVNSSVGMNSGYGGGMNPAAGMNSGYGGMATGGSVGGPYGAAPSSGNFQAQPQTKRSSLDSLDPFKM